MAVHVRAVPPSDDAISGGISRAQTAALGALDGAFVASTARTELAPQVSARGRETRAFARSGQIQIGHAHRRLLTMRSTTNSASPSSSDEPIQRFGVMGMGYCSTGPSSAGGAGIILRAFPPSKPFPP